MTGRLSENGVSADLSACEDLCLSALAERNDVVLVRLSTFHTRRPNHHPRHGQPYHVRWACCDELVDQVSGHVALDDVAARHDRGVAGGLSLIHISEPTRLL